MAVELKDGSLFLEEDGSVWQKGRDDTNYLIMASPRQHRGVTDQRQRPNTPTKLDRLHRLQAYCTMRDEIQQILDLQSQYTDEEAMDFEEPPWAPHQRQLEEHYDKFVGEFGPINKMEERGAFHGTYKIRPNLRDFREDPDAYLVASIEIFNDETDEYRKSAIFHDRIIAPEGLVPEFDSTRDALRHCVGERGIIDLDVIATRMQKPIEEVVSELTRERAMFMNPQTVDWDLAERYLSGNVREKLEFAEEAAKVDPFYAANVEELRRIMPALLRPEEIAASLGMPWIPIDVFEQFARESLAGEGISIRYVPETHLWFASGHCADATINAEYGSEGADPIHILRASLNNKPVEVDARYVDDKTAATIVARERQEILNEAFKNWVWRDPARAERLAEIYNRQYNSTVLRTYDGSHLTFPGSSQTIALHPHQKASAWRNVDNGNTLYGHEVGAGKTWASVAAAMEMRRLGKVDKPCFVVPNHLLEQWARDFKMLYPNSKLLVLDEDQFRERGRRIGSGARLERFIDRAAHQDWDAVILTQSNFDRLPARPEARLEVLLKEMQLAHILQERHAESKDEELERYFRNLFRHKRRRLRAFLDGLDPEMEVPEEEVIVDEDDVRGRRDDDDEEDRPIREGELSDDDLDELMKEPYDGPLWAPYVRRIYAQEALHYFSAQSHGGRRRPYFEDIGADYLFIDEGQDYKNLGVNSRLEGMATQQSSKAASLYAKLTHLRRTNPDSYLSIMTGTPVSNAISEMYNMQRYMQEPLLEAMGIHNFDAWVSMFADYVAAIEMAPEGGSYRIVSRIGRYKNVPELLKMFLSFADIVLGDSLNLPKPALKGGKHTTVSIPMDPVLESYIEELGDRAEAVRNRQVKPREDNMLKITNDGRHAALHPRLVGLVVPPGYKGKIGEVADEVATRYEQYKDNVYKDVMGEDEPVKGALQLVFCDIGTPKQGRGFTAYRELKEQLVARGIPEHRVRFIHDVKNDRQKHQLFEECRTGKVSVLVGSTQRLGTGTNVQKRLIAEHNMDAPWRPGDIDQRDGRGLRQGNQNEEIEILRYVVAGSFDTYMWQLLERKARFISQIMRGDTSIREMNDDDTNVLSYAEVKAIASGDPLVLEKAGTDNDFARMNRLRYAHSLGQQRVQADIADLGNLIGYSRDIMTKIGPVAEAVRQTGDDFPIVLNRLQSTDIDRIGRHFQTNFRRLRARLEEEGAAEDSPPSHTYRMELGTIHGYPLVAYGRRQRELVQPKREFIYREPQRGRGRPQGEKSKEAEQPKRNQPTTRTYYSFWIEVDDPAKIGEHIPIFNNEFQEPPPPSTRPQRSNSRIWDSFTGAQSRPLQTTKADDTIPLKLMDAYKRTVTRFEERESDIARWQAQIDHLRTTIGRPFEQEAEYQRLLARKTYLDAELERRAAARKEDRDASAPESPPTAAENWVDRVDRDEERETGSDRGK